MGKAQAAASQSKCRDCGVSNVGTDPSWDFENGICSDCTQRRVDRRRLARRTATEGAGDVSARLGALQRPPTPQFPALTAAERSLISRLKTSLSVGRLLGVLNDRRAADGNDDYPLLTHAQLGAILASTNEAVPGARTGGDWAALRKLLRSADRSGLLQRISPQLIEDFAIIYSLSPAQIIRLREIISDAAGESP